ncbi:MAG: hypothetical protein AAF620_00125 [Bacteroidota bacterium]
MGKCKGECGQTRYIVNKRHYLCQQCNYTRLHGEGALAEKYKKAALLLKGKVKKASSVKPKSEKQQTIERELANVYREIALERPHICTGCGNTQNLSHSHIIRRSWSQDFVIVKDNITYHCLIRQNGSEGCHSRWESASRWGELQDYQKNMDYIRRVAPELYRQMKLREKIVAECMKGKLRKCKGLRETGQV